MWKDVLLCVFLFVHERIGLIWKEDNYYVKGKRNFFLGELCERSEFWNCRMQFEAEPKIFKFEAKQKLCNS
jgi:hypothetical protein